MKEGPVMYEFFINDTHQENFFLLTNELGFTDLKDPYWRSIIYIVSSNSVFLSYRHKLLNSNDLEINSDFFFNGPFSQGEKKLLGLGYNLFTGQDYYEYSNGDREYFSPLDIFSSLDSNNQKIAMNAISVRLLIL